MSGGARLEVSGLEITRGARAVLRIASLAIEPGESVAILGPNGAGKSTLLSALAGLLAPDAGSVRVDGADPARLDVRRRLALVPQDAPMLRGTVRRNVELPLKLRGHAAGDRAADVARALDEMGAAALAGRDARALSGGESRRVAIARALAGAPAALFLDEPTNGLDGPARESLVERLRGARRDRTLVLVTQSRDEALQVASRLIVLRDGRIAQDGPTTSVLSRPADAEIARFLGAANVLDAVVVDRVADGVSLQVGGGRVLVAEQPPVAPGAHVWLLIAPEHVELRAPGASGETSARNVFAGTVEEIVPREGRMEVRVAAPFPLTAVLTRGSVERLGLAPGSAVEAVFKATACHLIALPS